MRFELEKLTRSLRMASEELGQELPLDTTAELARMAKFFLCEHLSDQVIGSEDVADWVEKSLHETGQDRLAESFCGYRRRKIWARSSLVVAGDAAANDVEPAQSSHWDKSQIVQALRVRLKLDTRRSREIASRVEHAVLAGKFPRLTTGLIREIINNELDTWGIRERLEPSSQVHISTTELKRHLSRPGGPSAASRLVAGKIWRDFALHEIVSRDVADAERRGLLRIHGLESPATLAASCVDCRALVRQARESRESIAQFGARLAATMDASSSLVAVDSPESWLTFVAGANDSPAQLVDIFWQELNSRVRNSPAECVLNLSGGLAGAMDLGLGAGPLFSQQPLSAEREFAGAVSQEILGRFQRDGSDWPNLRVDWHWSANPDPVQAALAYRVVRVLSEGLSVSIVFDRGRILLAEGLRRGLDLTRPVLDYVGISLPTLWRDAGSPRSLPAIEDSMARTIQLAVRGAVQKREFIRRLPTLIDGSSIDQAILAVSPIGLDWTVRQLVGHSFAEDEGALKLAETLVRYLREAAEREARFFALGVVVEHPASSMVDRSRSGVRDESDDSELLVGLNPCTSAGLRRQIHAAGRLHAIADAGTLTCASEPSTAQDSYGLTQTIEWASQNSQLIRMRFMAQRHPAAQAMVHWPDP